MVLVIFRTLFHSERAQATIEAAFVLPVALLCIGLSVQPIVYMYTKSIVQEAAYDGVRFASSESDDKKTERYVLRRLQAIPTLEIFHLVDMNDWNIELTRTSSAVELRISGHIKPIPIIGTPSTLVLPHDEKGLVVQSQARIFDRPSWREGGYDDWVSELV